MPPFISVFFSSFIEKNAHIKIQGINLGSYHSIIEFPYGFKPDLTLDWKQKIQKYNNKKYLPLIHFNTSKTEKISIERNNVISQSCGIIKTVAKIPSNIYSGISYLISEITDNIIDHSTNERGWISFQYYPGQGYIDFCMADSGIGLLGSYKNYKGDKDFSHINTHLEAMDSVIKGDSTKHLNERGFGVHTSREMLIRGLGGTFIILSGNALLRNYDLIEMSVFNTGNLVMLRIPCNSFDKNFSYNNFVE